FDKMLDEGDGLVCGMCTVLSRVLLYGYDVKATWGDEFVLTFYGKEQNLIRALKARASPGSTSRDLFVPYDRCTENTPCLLSSICFKGDKVVNVTKHEK